MFERLLVEGLGFRVFYCLKLLCRLYLLHRSNGALTVDTPNHTQLVAASLGLGLQEFGIR